MRSPEEQQDFLDHGRFQELPDGSPVPPPRIYRVARIGCLSLLATLALVTLTWLGLSFLGRQLTKVVAAEERAAPTRTNPASYRYSVELYRWNQPAQRRSDMAPLFVRFKLLSPVL